MMADSGRALGMGLLLVLTACANGQSVMPGFADKPSAIGLTIVDDRPKADTQSEILSLSVSSCAYGIRRLGDETTVPPRLALLRRDLEDALGARLANTTVHVTRYTLYWNSKASAAASRLFVPIPAGQDSILDKLTLGQTCTPEETGEAWVAPTRDITQPPLVVIAEATIDGKAYRARTFHVPAGKYRITEPTPDMFVALHKANAELARQIAAGRVP